MGKNERSEIKQAYQDLIKSFTLLREDLVAEEESIKTRKKVELLDGIIESLKIDMIMEI